MKSTRSFNKIEIRVTAERWFHITEGHPEMAGLFYEILETISSPDKVFVGEKDEYIAVRSFNNKFLVAVYKEVENEDGFLITSFISRKINYLLKREIAWERIK